MQYSHFKGIRKSLTTCIVDSLSKQEIFTFLCKEYFSCLFLVTKDKSKKLHIDILLSWAFLLPQRELFDKEKTN